MADLDIPADVLELKRQYYAADARCYEIAAGLPSSVDVVNLEAEPDPERQADLVEARSDRLRLVEEINRHPWLAGGENRHARWMALSKAARESVAAPAE
ncbi:hypothetical protein [Nonomuraea typhae]|uniref:hypothetical protein n=1 Tax=Nonomuraea typhae TaxID=2603600 RepID=UPI0012FBCEE7|nr:hypothetical protein [Nonomuraea typhae]